MEQAVEASDKRLKEKMQECARLGAELDHARVEAAHALQRAHERTDTIHKCLQTAVADLERQLAVARAQVKAAEKERLALQRRMQCQIECLNENFEQAQMRILYLATQLQTLRAASTSSHDNGDVDVEVEAHEFEYRN